MPDTLELSEALVPADSGSNSDFVWGGMSSSADSAAPNVTPQQVSSAYRPARQQLSQGSKKITKADLLMFTSQLAVMCKSGVDIAEALRDTTEHCQHPQLRPVLDAVYHDVSNGIPLSDALRRHEGLFGGAYIGSIAAAESSGRVDVILSRLAELLRNQIRLRGTLVATLSYPVALTGIASLVIFALIFFVLPQFDKVFEKMQKTPPPMTRVLLDGAAVARGNAVPIGVAFVVILAVLFQYSRTEHYQRLRDKFVLNVVLLGTASRSLFTGTSFRLMGCLLQSGVPLLEAVALCRASVKNSCFRELFDHMEHDVTHGAGIGPAISASPFLPSGVSPMVATAERTGRLGEVLELVGEYYEEDGERRLRQVVSLLEPAVIILMGIVVAVVVSSVMLPLLNVSSMSH